MAQEFGSCLRDQGWVQTFTAQFKPGAHPGVPIFVPVHQNMAVNDMNVAGECGSRDLHENCAAFPNLSATADPSQILSVLAKKWVQFFHTDFQKNYCRFPEKAQVRWYLSLCSVRLNIPQSSWSLVTDPWYTGNCSKPLHSPLGQHVAPLFKACVLLFPAFHQL